MNQKFLEKLIGVLGVSGDEGRVRDLIKKEIKPFADELTVGKLGSLIARKKGKGPKIMLTAHMDEIGLIVKRINKDGRIVCSKVGGMDELLLIGEKVEVETKKGKLRGVISTKDVSDNHDYEEVPTIVDLFIDTGFTKKELDKYGVKIGSYVSLIEEAESLGSKNVILGKALDNRVGCFILTELAKKLSKAKLNADIYFVFTVQEEVGLYGARTSTYKIEPDMALVVDATNANDSSKESTKVLGKGPCITIKDEDMIANEHMTDYLELVAKRKKIPVQLEVSNAGTTDASSVAISKVGVPVALISFPVRNLHTTFGIVHKKDIQYCIKLAEAFLRKPLKLPSRELV